MPIEEALAKLRRATADLQAETEALNEGIATFDARLAEIAPGVLVWLDHELPDQRTWILGYARMGGKLTVAVRQGEAEPMPLVNAPRHVRVAAVALFGELVAALTARACEHTAEIRAACAQLLNG